MKKRVMIVLFALVAVMLIVGVKIANKPPIMQEAKIVTVEDRIAATGLIVRNEQVFYATATGTVYFGISEGERVSKDTLISKIYQGTISEDKLKELSTVDKRIAKAVEKENSSTLYSAESSSADSAVKSSIENIYESAKSMDAAGIADYKHEINNLRTGTGKRGATLEELRNEKTRLEESIGTESDNIYSDISGVFSTYLDGLEGVLQPERIEQYTPSYISGLEIKPQEKAVSSAVGVGDPICKVVNNHVWYTLSVISTADLGQCKKGQTVQLRFKNMADATTEGTVEYISKPDQFGNALVMIRVSTYLDSAFAYRSADMDIIFKSYTGYQVPVYAVRTKEDGSHMVIGVANNQRFNCDVDVVYTDTESEYALIESSEEAVNKLSKAEQIIVSNAE